MAGAFLALFAMLCGGCVDGVRPGNATLRDYTGLDGCGWVIGAHCDAVGLRGYGLIVSPSRGPLTNR